ncbi:MAG: SpaH/EbpB family LPXTG-anchored major pilin, partial [Corynebacterium sp.]|nr:SpaH/EbpB family LPXTG-anchored major pilin [Corynebacterium sp.]
TKTVKDIDQNIGGTIEYDIDTVVRKIADGKRLSYYYISDTLDVNNLDVAGAQIAVTVDGTPVAKDSDYELVKDDATGHVLVRFKAEGLKKLTSGAKVKVNVKATKITNGRVVPNSAFEYEPSSPESDQDVKSDTEPPKTPPNENRNETPLVITYFSEVEFKKVDAGRTGLSGAEFQLLRTKAGDKECNASMAAEITEGAKKVQGSLNGGATPVDTFVSDQNGKVNISGLHVTDFADNADVASENQSVYCLYETKAPAGKELLAKPLTFTLMRSGTTTLQRNVTVYETVNGVTSAHTETRDYDALVYEPVALTVGDNNGEVVNLDDTTPNLPLTGGAGVGILAAIGALIVGAGAWFARRSVQS